MRRSTVAVLTAVLLAVFVLAAKPQRSLASSSFNFGATADSYVKSATPNANFGLVSTLALKYQAQETYLRFTVSGLDGPVTGATLQLWTTVTLTGANAIGLHALSGSWTETGVTWNNRPSQTTLIASRNGPVQANSWVTFDVSSVVTGPGTYEFGLTTGQSTALSLNSREAASNQPTLGVTTSGPATTTTAAATTTTTPGSYNCTSAGSGVAWGGGGAVYPQITNSNGYTTYVENNMWGAQPGTTQTICAKNPGDWYVTANTDGSQGGAVQTYPNAKQQMDNYCSGQHAWNAPGGIDCPTSMIDTPIADLTTLSSTYVTVNPAATSGNWEVAYDIWLSNSPYNEIMVWLVTSSERGTGGATVITPHVTIDGKDWHFMVYGGSLPQLVLNVNQAAGTVDLLAVLHYLQTQGWVSSGAQIGQLDFGVEVCNTDTQSLQWATTGYSLTMAA